MQGLSFLGVENGAIAFDSIDRADFLRNFDITSPVYRTRSHTLLTHAPVSVGYFLRFLRIMRDYESAIVHLPNPFAALCILVSGYRGRVVLYWHADVVGKGIAGWLLWPLERLLIRRSNAVIAPTSKHITGSRHARQLQNGSHVVSFPMGNHLLDTARARIGTRRRITRSPVRLLAIGRTVRYKGFDVLIRSLTRVGVDCRLDILGDGPLQSELQSLADELGLSGKVRLHGSVPDEVRNQFLADADIFCLPSTTKAEMLGVVQAEAMAHGVPVISTDIPGSGAPEFTQQSGAGLVVPPGDESALASAIEKLAADEALYSRLSAAGIAFVSDQASQTNALRQLVRICAGETDVTLTRVMP
jgi:rhamnosyl/mannosyltransferase